MAGPAEYRSRIIDDELDELLRSLSAIAVEGPKGVGKTRTALRRAKTVVRLDDPGALAVARADPERLLQGDRPVLFDEWQRFPLVWDLVRRADDEGAAPGSFLLTGSAVPDPPADPFRGCSHRDGTNAPAELRRAPSRPDGRSG